MTDWTIGADEVGRGALAGPLVICAALVPGDWNLPGLNDSKKLSAKKREKFSGEIQSLYPFVRTFVDWTPSQVLDQIGLGPALKASFRRVVEAALRIEPGARIILDGQMKLDGIRHEAYPKADATYPAVMAASVVAKVERDAWMATIAHQQWPEYSFATHVGYGTAVHLTALDKHGPCPIHRMSFEPVFRRAGIIADNGSLSLDT